MQSIDESTSGKFNLIKAFKENLVLPAIDFTEKISKNTGKLPIFDFGAYSTLILKASEGKWNTSTYKCVLGV